MKHTISIFVLVLMSAVCCLSAAAQAPSVTVDPSRHGNLAAAQESIVTSFLRISDAQHDNDDHLGGHAGRAKDLLRQANEEIQLAADFADQNPQSGPSEGPLPPPQQRRLLLRRRRPTYREPGPFTPTTRISREAL
jgi:hypothetical protein